MNPGKMLPLPCFLLCIQPVGQKESEANPVPSSTWERHFPREKDQQEYQRGYQGAIACRQPPAAGTSKDIYVQKGLQLGPHQHKVALHRALHLCIHWVSVIHSQRLLHTLQQASLNSAGSAFQDFLCWMFETLQSGLEIGNDTTNQKGKIS